MLQLQAQHQCQERDQIHSANTRKHKLNGQALNAKKMNSYLVPELQKDSILAMSFLVRI